MIRVKWEITTTEKFEGTFDEEQIPEEMREILDRPGTELFPFEDVDAEFLADFEAGESPYAKSIEYEVTDRTILTAKEES